MEYENKLIRESILVVVSNHNLNQKAINLKTLFSEYCNTILLDSGSSIKDSESIYFDHKLPNVYYSGLFNKSIECLNSSSAKILLFIASDVTIENAQYLLRRILIAFNEKNAGIYAPSADYSCHAQMKPRNTSKMGKATFTDGFCFAANKDLLNQMYPVDVSINSLGHGLDIYLGYLALINNKQCLIDNDITVKHPKGSGYSGKLARKQRDTWFASKDKKARWFHHWASQDILKNKFGRFVILLSLILWIKSK